LSEGWVGSAAYVCSALLVGGIKSAKCFSNEMLLLENTVSELAQKFFQNTIIDQNHFPEKTVDSNNVKSY
jgi:hypothetical protein